MKHSTVLKGSVSPVTRRLYPLTLAVAVALMIVSCLLGICRSLVVYHRLPAVSFEYWGEVRSEIERSGPAVAVGLFRQAAEIDLTRPDAYLKLWHAANLTEDEDNQIFALRGLVRHFPDDPKLAPSRLQLAVLLMKKGDFAEADRQSRAAVRLLPNDAKAREIRATVLQQIDNLPDTLAE